MRTLADYPDVLKPKEAKEILRVGRNKLYQMLQSGEIQCKREGHLFIIPKSAVLQYLNGLGDNCNSH